MKLMPWSQALSMMRSESSVLVCSPNIMVPRVRALTFNPDWPNVR